MNPEKDRRLGTLSRLFGQRPGKENRSPGSWKLRCCRLTNTCRETGSEFRECRGWKRLPSPANTRLRASTSKIGSCPSRSPLKLFNPLIPLDPENSSLPLAVLRYRVQNPGLTEASVSIVWNLNNPIGAVLGQAGRVNEYRETPELKGLFMHNPALEPAHPRKGSLALAVTANSGDVSYIASWRDHVWEMPMRAFWDDFSEDGRLNKPSEHASFAPDYVSVAAGSKSVPCVFPKRLPPAGRERCTFLLTWHIPNRTPEGCGWDAL